MSETNTVGTCRSKQKMLHCCESQMQSGYNKYSQKLTKVLEIHAAMRVGITNTQ